MKRTAALLFVMTIAGAASAQGYTQGYTRADGTYVQGHYQSAPDSIRSNNLNSQTTGMNPYTGQQGHQRDENSSPPQYNQSNPLYTPPMGGTQHRCHRDQFGNTRC